MIAVGIAGAPPILQADGADISPFMFHDAAAAVVVDGELVAAIEEERCQRVKHTNHFPARAMAECLRVAGVRLAEVDRFAYYWSEEDMNRLLWAIYARSPGQARLQRVRELLVRAPLLRDVPDIGRRLAFVDHQLAHAVGAYCLSGFENCLVVSLDGVGDRSAGLVLAAREGEREVLRRLTPVDSIGMYFLEVIRLIGFDQFEEYKVMGMAAYGDPGRFKVEFSTFYRLLEGGQFEIRRDRIASTLLKHVTPRRQGRKTAKTDLDVAAALQASVEEIVLHMLAYFRKATGLRRLVFTGGVSLNSCLNGAIRERAGFERLYVPPGPHDAGCAIGAAYQIQLVAGHRSTPAPLATPYLGRALGSSSEIKARLEAWRGVLEVAPLADPEASAAELLDRGEVIGWCQGRAEYGPRALGNRSILGDPRRRASRRIINGILKSREHFRPLAPAVTAEDFAAFFESSETDATFEYMGLTARVRPHQQKVLAATTHVDGSARVQIVSSSSNPLFWRLLRAFASRSGVPVLLNTSFNGPGEPIVDSVDDIVASFLKLRLRYVVLADVLLSRPLGGPRYSVLAVRVPEHVELLQRRSARMLRNSYRHEHFSVVSQPLYSALCDADGTRSLQALISERDPSGPGHAIVIEALRLWRANLLVLEPIGKSNSRPDLNEL